MIGEHNARSAEAIDDETADRRETGGDVEAVAGEAVAVQLDERGAVVPGCVVASIVTGSLIVGSVDKGVMVCTPEPIAKLIVSGPALLFEFTIACLSDPAPLSFVLTTRKLEGAPTTVVVIVAELFAGVGSVWLAATEAMLTSDPMNVGVMTTVTVAVPPLGSDPSGHVKVVVPLHVP